MTTCLGRELHGQTFILFSWMLALGWLRQAIMGLRGMPHLPDLTRIDATTLPSLPAGKGPHLTVVVPACNEEESIQATLHSLLASTGLRLEIIAVDDRSTDRTGVLMDQIAAEAVAYGGLHRLQVIHINELPAGWLGKPHALQLGTQQATAPWLLFTDGDLLFAPQALELALRQANAGQADHLVLVPSLIRKSFGEAAMQATIQALVQWSVRLWKVSDPDTKDFFGVGGFNLVRTEVFNHLGGFAALRMEVVEDLSFGRMVKHAGYRSCVTVGPDLVKIRWIHGASGIVSNVEKNGFAAFRYRLGLSLAALPRGRGTGNSALGGDCGGRLGATAGLLTYASIALVFHANRRLNGVSPALAVLFAPIRGHCGFWFPAFSGSHVGSRWSHVARNALPTRRPAPQCSTVVIDRAFGFLSVASEAWECKGPPGGRLFFEVPPNIPRKSGMRKPNAIDDDRSYLIQVPPCGSRGTGPTLENRMISPFATGIYVGLGVVAGFGLAALRRSICHNVAGLANSSAGR